MVNALIIISILGFIMGIAGTALGAIALIKMMAMEKSTHTVQMQPIQESLGEQYFTPDVMPKVDEVQEVPTKDLEEILLQGLK